MFLFQAFAGECKADMVLLFGVVAHHFVLHVQQGRHGGWNVIYVMSRRRHRLEARRLAHADARPSQAVDSDAPVGQPAMVQDRCDGAAAIGIVDMSVAPVSLLGRGGKDVLGEGNVARLEEHEIRTLAGKHQV